MFPRAGAVGALLLLTVPAVALDPRHNHPPEDAPIHEKFYNTWMRPNPIKRTVSCCNAQDCYAVQTRRVGSSWEFLRREDKRWTRIPDEVIEQYQADPRESPDNRSHVCAGAPLSGGSVYCFTFGSGL